MSYKIKQSILVARRAYSICSINQFASQIPNTPYPGSTLSNPSLLKLICSNGRLWEALHEMAVQGVEMKFEGYDTILNECVNRKAIREGQRVHAHMIKARYLPPLYLRTRLVVLYCKCACLADARQVFDEMPERNVISWTAMMSGYSQNGLAFEAVDLLVQMLRSGTQPNEFTFATILTCCAGENGVLGRQIHSLIIRSNYDSHIFVGSSLLDMYAKAGKIHEARAVFESLPDRDVVSCTAIISGYAQLGLDREAIEMYRELQKEGMSSNYVTYTSILTALSGLASLHHGKQVHNHVLRCQIPSSYVVLQNSLIDMYAKCGNLTYARRVFDLMPERTVISWNSMLVGYSKHGMGEQVIELFNVMRKEKKVRPDSVTFLAVLSGCSHGAMEDNGMRFFDELVSGKDGVHLNIEHCGCVVDLLGRAGELEKALKFIEQMPFEPTAAIWGSLLGACRLHYNVGIGEIVGNRLLEIEPENAGNYVILSNLYASAGRWEDVRYLRRLMQDMDVTKEPGRSWIELDQTLHTFHASDRSHPQKDEVHAKVKELAIKFKEAGYEPDLSCVLHDVDEEQKEKILLGHSEKLALSFGLMNTRKGASLLVIKNLRICVDCHNFAKFISRLYGIQVSLRDKNRFHHIVRGTCSCGDYW